jgi:hypothetical protein
LYLSPDIARIVFWICVACCVIAQAGIMWSTARASRAPAAADPQAADSVAASVRRPIEFLWALLPAVALVLVFAGTWKAIDGYSTTDQLPMPAPQQPSPALTGAPTHLAARRESPAPAFVKPQATPKRASPIMGAPSEGEVTATLPEYPMQPESQQQ